MSRKIFTNLLVLLLALAFSDIASAHGGLTPVERNKALESHQSGPEKATEAASDNRSTIEERLRALEADQAEFYHTLAEKKAAGRASRITDRITLSGLLEVEASAESVDFADGTNDAASDLVLATAQVGLGLEMTDEVSGNVSLLFEEDQTDLEVDEAAIDLNFDSLFGRVGRFYLPFGVFHSHFISDPLTLELGETRETALLLGYGHALFSFSAFVFNGDAEKIGEEDHLRDWGASLTITPAGGIELGGSYLADLADSDAGLSVPYSRRVGGWSAFTTLERGPFEVTAEILGATRSFAAADLDGDGNGRGDKPLTWNFELSWAPEKKVELAVRYEGSDEFAGRPGRRYGANVSWRPRVYTTLSLEYLRGEFDSAFGIDGDGNLLDRRDLVTAQLAFEF